MPTISATHRTNSLGYAQTASGFHATRYATARGRQLTHIVSINFDRLGVAEENAVPLFQALKGKVARAWRYAASKGAPLGTMDYFHVQENPHGRRNAHWAVHLPDGHRNWFQSKVERALKLLLELDDLGDAVHLTQIATPGSAAKYLLKGLDQRYAEHFHMTNWAADQGTVTGRRFGTSRSLGPSARRRNWRRKLRITS